MASEPAFAAEINVGVVRLTTGVTTRDSSASPGVFFTPGANGSKLNRVIIKAEADPTACVLLLWAKFGGTTWAIIKEIAIADPAAGSTTVAAYEYELNVADRDWCFPLGCLLGATVTVTPTTGGINVIGLGANF